MFVQWSWNLLLIDTNTPILPAILEKQIKYFQEKGNEKGLRILGKS